MNEEINGELNVNDEEPMPKRIHVSETLVREEETCEPSYWDRLPYNVTVQVYSYLKDSDRVAMAQVCQAWYLSFKDPSLWTSRKFHIGGPDGEQKCVKMIQFASNFGRYLKDVEIRFPKRILKSSKCIPEMLENLMVELENARLCRLKLIDLESSMDKISLKFKDTLARCLVKILKSQTALKHVEFIRCLLYDKPGTEVLKVLQESSGQTLESLDLVGFFQTAASYFEEGLLKYVLRYTDLEKFTNLREIRIDYGYISEEIIQRWTVDLKNKLELITLEFLDIEVDLSNLITNTTWVNLKEACPQLKVDFSIYHFCMEIDLIEILAPGIPLTALFLTSDVKNEQDLKLAASLKHIADNFDQELESLILDLPCLQDSVDNEIARVVETCRKLTTICVPASAAFGVATALCNGAKEGQVRNVELQIGRGGDKAKSHQDIMKTIHGMFSEFPNLKVELNEDE